MSDALEAKLLAEVATVPFTPLAPHAGRGGLLLLAVEHDLVATAAAIARNDAARVEALLREGALRKPDAEELARYAAAPEDHAFRFLIVQPFVVAQAAI